MVCRYPPTPNDIPIEPKDHVNRAIAHFDAAAVSETPGHHYRCLKDLRDPNIGRTIEGILKSGISLVNNVELHGAAQLDPVHVGEMVWEGLWDYEYVFDTPAPELSPADTLEVKINAESGEQGAKVCQCQLECECTNDLVIHDVQHYRCLLSISQWESADGAMRFRKQYLTEEASHGELKQMKKVDVGEFSWSEEGRCRAIIWLRYNLELDLRVWDERITRKELVETAKQLDEWVKRISEPCTFGDPEAWEPVHSGCPQGGCKGDVRSLLWPSVT